MMRDTKTDLVLRLDKVADGLAVAGLAVADLPVAGLPFSG
jgi:hypothetical protein